MLLILTDLFPKTNETQNFANAVIRENMTGHSRTLKTGSRLTAEHTYSEYDAYNEMQQTATVNSSNYYTLTYRPNLPFLISDVRALWRSALSARVPECQTLKMYVTSGWH